MQTLEAAVEPMGLLAILRDTEALGFAMASDRLTGSLLRSLAASKPGGEVLELGTGTGAGAAWLLDGLDAQARLLSVDHDGKAQAIAKRHLGSDARVTFCTEDGGQALQRLQGRTFDLIFADTWPGKFEHLGLALDLLKPGAFYVVDDLIPQPNWPEDHARKVPAFIALFKTRRELVLTELHWSTGLIVAAKKGNRK